MAHQRRLAVLCSHIRPDGPSPGAATAVDVALSLSRCRGEPDGEKACVFCSIIQGELPAFKLYEDSICLCILDSNPLSYGHSLVIPKLHFSSLAVTPPPVVAAMSSKLPFLCDAIMKATQCESFNLLVNNGSAAGQVVFHTHFHIIPRKAGDHLWRSESCHREPLEGDQQTIRLAKDIRELLSYTDDCKCEEGIISKEAHD